MLIGGNNAKNIGIYLIDSGLLKKSEIAHDLFRTADFASDCLVLHLALDDSVHDFLALDYIYPNSLISLSCTLLFMREYLACLNSKGMFTAEERVYMLKSNRLCSYNTVH